MNIVVQDRSFRGKAMIEQAVKIPTQEQIFLLIPQRSLDYAAAAMCLTILTRSFEVLATLDLNISP